MIKNISTILIWSEDFRALADWYQEMFDLEVINELDHPQDTGVLFQAGDITFWIGQHSQVHGKNQDIHRHMFNFRVDSVHEAYEKLQAKGVTFLAKPFKAPTMEKYFATMYDLDDNLIQLVGER